MAFLTMLLQNRSNVAVISRNSVRCCSKYGTYRKNSQEKSLRHGLPFLLCVTNDHNIRTALTTQLTGRLFRLLPNCHLFRTRPGEAFRGQRIDAA